MPICKTEYSINHFTTGYRNRFARICGHEVATALVIHQKNRGYIMADSAFTCSICLVPNEELSMWQLPTQQSTGEGTGQPPTH